MIILTTVIPEKTANTLTINGSDYIGMSYMDAMSKVREIAVKYRRQLVVVYLDKIYQNNSVYRALREISHVVINP